MGPGTTSTTDPGRQAGTRTAAHNCHREGPWRSHSDGFAPREHSHRVRRALPERAGLAASAPLRPAPHTGRGTARTAAGSPSAHPGGRPGRSRARRGLRGPPRPAAAGERGRRQPKAAAHGGAAIAAALRRRPGTATYRGAQESGAQARRPALHLRALLPDPPRPWRGAPKRGRPGRRSEAEGKRRRPRAPAPSHRGTGARAGGTRRTPLAPVIDTARRPLAGREAHVRLGEGRGSLVGRADSQ